LALPALGSGEVTFGCLNRPMKLNVRVARLWAELVRAVPRSRLLVLNEHGPAVGELFARAGMPPGRLLVARPRPTHDYLSLYHGIDVALDPFPYGGMTTTCDALCMGVPVVTLAGPAAPSRAGVSLLNGVGHPEWVATTPSDYVATAASLADDLPRLAHLRRTMRRWMAASALCDGVGLARRLESAYREMWRAWCGAELRAG
jgi:predicted O-linked N-acetylglucosamine transferase (SPINDLY family)